ncbi:MAG: DoxX family protein [Steroidobacteraceae bacterium]
MLRRLAGPLFVFTGILHFVAPEVYARIVPPYLPAAKALVYASGVAEVGGGVRLMVPR